MIDFLGAILRREPLLILQEIFASDSPRRGRNIVAQGRAERRPGSGNPEIRQALKGHNIFFSDIFFSAIVSPFQG